MRKIILLAALCSAPIALQTPARAQVAAPSASSIPDVSNLEYRAVTLAPQEKPRFGPAPSLAARLWVVPAHDGKASVGIGWNGVPYELQSVGDKADWRADVEAFLKPPVPGQRAVWPRPFEFAGLSVARQLLLRLGATDLMGQVAKQVKLYSPPNSQSDYLQNLRGAGVTSFVAGQSSQARLQLNKLLELWPTKTPANTYDLRLDAKQILADIERREHDAPRPTEEIAGLIWDLQNVRAYQMSVPGSISWTENPTIQKLCNAGDSAVEPLLDTLQNDDRLTLSVYAGRSFPGPGPIGTVRDAAQDALQVLLRHRYYATNYQVPIAQSGANIAAQMRADWEKIKSVAPVDRVFNALAQSGQTPERLEEAARELVRKGAPYGPNIFVRLPSGTLQSGYAGQSFFGEPLRARQNPSVSDLLEARIHELSQRALKAKPSPNALDPTLMNKIGEPDPNVAINTLATANELAVIYAQWDPKRALPMLGAQLELTKTFVAKAPSDFAISASDQLNRTRRQFLAARLKSPFRAGAMREYGEFLASQPFGRFNEEDYLPLWRFPNEPAMIKAAHALFDAPRRPYQEAAQWKTNGFNYDVAFRLLHSPLIKNPIFKSAVLRELKNTTPVATLRKTKNGEAEIKVTASSWGGQTITLGDQKLENGAGQPLRVADLVGFWLLEDLTLEKGLAKYRPLLDVALSTAKRDARLKQIAVLVTQGKVVAEDFGVLDLEF